MSQPLDLSTSSQSLAAEIRPHPVRWIALARNVLVALTLLLCSLAIHAQSAATPVILILGDSLSAGYGLARNEGWVSLLEARLKQREPAWQLVNASVSGETTAGGRSRIDDALSRHQPHVVVLALGANDGLRGLPVDTAETNLAAMITAAKAKGAKVLLVGMRMPPNYGPAYTQAFETMYAQLASRHAIALLPFLLAPIASEREAFQADNLHPVAEVQGRLLEHVWVALEPLLAVP